VKEDEEGDAVGEDEEADEERVAEEGGFEGLGQAGLGGLGLRLLCAEFAEALQLVCGEWRFE
jgi:hypothetical protein